MAKPIMLSLLKLALPRIKKIDENTADRIAHVGFDSDGQCWGLVERLRRIPDVSINAGKLNYHRWVRFEAIPFVPDEVVTADEWSTRG